MSDHVARKVQPGVAMKVAILVNRYPSVSHTFVRREVAALETLGAEVRRFSVRAMAAADLPDPLDREELARTKALLAGGARGLLKDVATRCLREPAKFAAAFLLATRLGKRSERGYLRNYAYLAEACVLARETEEASVDHVHAHFGTNSAAVAMLCRAVGGPSYSFTAHGPEEFDGPQQLSLPDKIAGAAFVVGVSEFGRSQILRHTKAERWDDVHVVRCGLDADFLERPRSSVPDVPEFVCVGRLCEQKGQLVLIDALAELRARGIRARIKLVGDGPMRADIEARAAAAGVSGDVEITGWASSAEVLQAIEGARALVLPSFAEGLPVVLMEAMARGRPVITTYVAGAPELVDSDVGFMVPAGSVSALTDALASALARSPHKLTDMGRRGSHRVAEQHDALRNGLKLFRLIRRHLCSEPAAETAKSASISGNNVSAGAELSAAAE